MTDDRTQRKEALLARRREIEEDAKARAADVEEELSRIEAEEEREKDAANFHRLVKLLDQGDMLLPLLSHTRSSCSDDNPRNDYTTRGRGGHFRCNKCAFIRAVKQWKNHRDWLLEKESGKDIEDILSCQIGNLTLDLWTDAI